MALWDKTVKFPWLSPHGSGRRAERGGVGEKGWERRSLCLAHLRSVRQSLGTGELHDVPSSAQFGVSHPTPEALSLL